MIGLSLSQPGHPFGWSVASQEIAQALGLLTETVDLSATPKLDWDCPILHGVQGPNMLPIRSALDSSVRDVGYCFIEEPLLAARYVINAARSFSALVTGSTWCAETLKAAFGNGHPATGLQIPITTAIQGIAPRFFDVPPRDTDDRFIVFSGGKAEYRKSQDVVIKAMKVFMGRHADVWLNYAWHNPWNMQIPGYAEVLLAARALDARRVIGPRFASVDHSLIAAVYRMADVGLFPNRCEAGTNMVMCEFMACGKPVIASYETGHKDVLVPKSQFNLIHGSPLTVRDTQGQPTGIWVEPDLDEVIANLEDAYENRDLLPALGGVSRGWVSEFTWSRCAQELLKALNGGMACPDLDAGGLT